MASGIPPPPTKDESGSFAWVDWYNKLTAYLNNGNSVPWAVVNKAGSLLSDIATRTHVMLQAVQGGSGTEQYHFTSAEHTFLLGLQGAPSVTGSRAGNAALASLLTKLAALGLITDNTIA